jgi:hypothetical protein
MLSPRRLQRRTLNYETEDLALVKPAQDPLSRFMVSLSAQDRQVQRQMCSWTVSVCGLPAAPLALTVMCPK